MAKTKKKSAAGRYKTQVQAESTLKFGPQASSLAAQLRDADTQYKGDVAVAHGTAAAIEHAAKVAKPKLTSDFKTAQKQVGDTESSLAADLAKLPNAGALAGTSARDAEGTKRRLAEALANTKAETDSRAREAVSGESFAISNARSRRADTRGKIKAQETEIAREQGAFAQGRTGELVEAGRARSVTRRGQDKTAATARQNRKSQDKRAQASLGETHRHNVQTEKNARDAAAAKKNAADPKATEKFGTTLTRAKSQVARVMGEVSDKDKAAGKTRRGRHEVAGIVVNGRPGQKIENDPKTGAALANPINIPEVKASDQLATSVALDIAYDGHISTANLKRLHSLHISVKDLGIPTAGRSGTKGAAKPAPRVVPAPRKPTRGKTNPLTGTSLGGLPG